MKEGLFVIACFLAFGSGFGCSMGMLLRTRSERVIAICAERNIEPEKCVAIGDAIYGE